MNFLWVGVGGFLGAITRYAVGIWITKRMGIHFPYHTLVINVTGCFLLGLSLTWLDLREALPTAFRMAGPIGFIGAYTTFSTFEYETLRTAQQGQAPLAMLYVIASLVIGYIAVWLGQVTGKAIV